MITKRAPNVTIQRSHHFLAADKSSSGVFARRGCFVDKHLTVSDKQYLNHSSTTDFQCVSSQRPIRSSVGTECSIPPTAGLYRTSWLSVPDASDLQEEMIAASRRPALPASEHRWTWSPLTTRHFRLHFQPLFWNRKHRYHLQKTSQTKEPQLIMCVFHGLSVPLQPSTTIVT